MISQRCRSRIRRIRNNLLLNNIYTAVYDRFFPAPDLGRKGEREAERYLLRKGHVIVDRGFDEGPGELDLVTVDGRTVVFVEVKTRTSIVKGIPAESVDDEKQKRISRTAISFMKRFDLMDCQARFDVISIVWPPKTQPKIEHIENAFEFALSDSNVNAN